MRNLMGMLLLSTPVYLMREKAHVHACSAGLLSGSGPELLLPDRGRFADRGVAMRNTSCLQNECLSFLRPCFAIFPHHDTCLSFQLVGDPPSDLRIIVMPSIQPLNLFYDRKVLSCPGESPVPLPSTRHHANWLSAA